MVLLLAKRLEGEDPVADHDGGLFSAILQNSHGNQSLGVAAFYQERCLFFNFDGKLSIEYPALRAGLCGRRIGPLVAKYEGLANNVVRPPVSFASVKATLKPVRQGLFRRRWYSEFSIQETSPDGSRRCSVQEAWGPEQGHTWSLLNEGLETLAAVREIHDQAGHGRITYHIFFTERKNMKMGLALGCVLMMTSAGILPGGPRFLDISTRQYAAPTDHSFFATAEHDEWDTFSTPEQAFPSPAPFGGP